jgi:membrane associated rhomboid family serine protease
VSLINRIQALRQTLPRITLSLALLQAAVFWGWQQLDAAKLREAVHFHLESALYGMESRNYLSHLAQQGRADEAARLERAHEAGNRLAVASALVADRDFEWALRETDEDFWGGTVYPDWREARTRLEAMTARFSRFHWGLSDAEQRPLTFLTHGFLSVNAWHWLLTCAGLLLAGSLIERRTGTLTLLLSVVAGVVVTGATVLLFDGGSALPRVGLEGAVGVLMGQLLWLRGRDRLSLTGTPADTAGADGTGPRTVPLWWLIPVWLALEIGLSFTDRALELVRWQALTGLVMGVLLARFLGQRLVVRSPAVVPDGDARRDLAFRQGLDHALQLQVRLDLRGAESALTSLNEEFPGRGEILERLAGLRAYLQGPAVLRDFIPLALEAMAADPGQVHASGRLHAVYRRDKSSPPLPQDLLERLMLQAAQRGALAFGRSLAQEAQQQGLVSERLARALASLADAFEAEDTAAAQRLHRQAAETASRLDVVRH